MKFIFDNVVADIYEGLVLSKDIIKHFYGDGVDLKVLKRNQVVAMIPVEMDARINVLHLLQVQ